MISLTRKSDYALVALAYLAKQRDECECGKVCPVSARAVADEYGLPRDMVMSLLKDLQRAGLVESERGAKGGYLLVHAPELISLASVVEAIEGAAKLTPCCGEEESDDDLCAKCQIVSHCPITGAIQDVNSKIVQYLGTITLRMLMVTSADNPLPVIDVAAPATTAGQVTITADERY